MRVLWTQKSEPDNHVYPWFLNQLRCNKPVAGYRYKILLNDASYLLMNFSLGTIFLLSFVCIYTHRIPAFLFVLVSTVFYMPLRLYTKDHTLTSVFKDLKSVCVTGFALLTLTPVFRSLTESISSDSIWALCGWLLFANFIFSCLSISALATNTALATTIVLASRLSSSMDVFYFVAFNIQTFVGLPVWFTSSMKSPLDTKLVLAIVVLGSLVLVVHVFHWALALAYFVILNSVFWGVPALFIKLQKYKNQISGPWDPAVPVLT